VYCIKKQGDLNGAVKAYRHLTAIDSTYANAYFNMGIILQEIEQYPDALSAFNQFVYYSSDAQLIGQVRQVITWLEQVVARQEEQGKIGWKDGSKTQ
jgi:tetratricopeptide (TPR) repeat protein